MVPSVALHAKTNLLYMQAKLPQEAWLLREAWLPWASVCSLRRPHLLLAGQLAHKSGVDQPLRHVR